MHHFYVLLQITFLSKRETTIISCASKRLLLGMSSKVVKKLALVAHDYATRGLSVVMLDQAFVETKLLHLETHLPKVIKFKSS
jgi:hypothetical protein